MRASVENRWVAVGRSDATDSETAGREAAAAAFVGESPVLWVVFAAVEHDPAALLAGVRSVAPEGELIGCSTAGEIATDGPGEAGVVVFALGGEGFAARTAAASVGADLREGGARVARAAALEGYPHRVLLLLTDSLGGDQQEIVRGAYSVLGARVPLVGGCAGDSLAMRETYQLHDRSVLRGAVVAASIGSQAPLGIGVQHGWRRVGEPMLVTASRGNLVLALDREPALDLYLERLQAPAAARRDAAAFTAFALTHPLGLSRRSDEDHVRFVGGADFDQRALRTIAAVPQGSLVWLMEGDERSVLDATDRACEAALAGLAGRPPLGVLAFDCIARKGVLGEAGVAGEVRRVAERAGAPVAGFYTYGEFARTRGPVGFHNQTLVLLAVG